MLAQIMEEKYLTFEIENMQQSENSYTDALVILGSQIAFEGSSTMVEINKRREPIIETLKEKFVEEEECEKDWRTPVRKALLGEGNREDYVLMKGELYCRMLGGILARYVRQKESLEEIRQSAQQNLQIL